MFKKLLISVAVVCGLIASVASAATSTYTVYHTPSSIVCGSDAVCSTVNHVSVQTVTVSGTVGTALYTWASSCPSSPDAVFYIRPTGATTGCFALEGFAPSTSSGVASVTGTTNQITSSPTTGSVVLSLPSTLIAPGTFSSTSVNVSGSTPSVNGLYLPSANTLGVSVNSLQVGRFTSTGLNATNIGVTTPGTGAFTTLSASSTVSGTGFSTYLASPPPVGSTAANTGAFTTLALSGNQTITANNASVSLNNTGSVGFQNISGSDSGTLKWLLGENGGITGLGIYTGTSPTLGLQVDQSQHVFMPSLTTSAATQSGFACLGTSNQLINTSVPCLAIAASGLSNGVTGSGSVVLATGPTVTSLTVASSFITFSGTTSGSLGPAIFPNSSMLVETGGTAGYQWNNQGNGASLMALSNTGGFTLNTYASCVGFTSNGSGTLACTVSDKRFKNPQGQIKNATKILQEIPAGRIFTYKDKNKYDARTHIGLYAQDVCKASTLLCAKRPNGDYNYEDRGVIALLVQAVQEQQKEIQALKKELAKRK